MKTKGDRKRRPTVKNPVVIGKFIIENGQKIDLEFKIITKEELEASRNSAYKYLIP